MVSTRRQYQNWVRTRGPNYQSSQESCKNCSQRSNDSNSINNDYTSNAPQLGPSYRPNDQCKRHRLQDDEEKSELVTSYRRRKQL